VLNLKLNDAFQITGRKFFISGQIMKGEIKEGQFMDLTIFGINKKVKIEVIEYLLKREGNKSWEDIALGTDKLTEDEKGLIKSKRMLGIHFDIMNEE
jgi:translation elongation factor EF-Tu-like GTPase